ncbi:MAG: caspase family protein [Candidatus Rokuibacteriota bacterium]
MSAFPYLVTHRASLGAAAVLAALALLACAVPSTAQPGVAERPTYQMGDRWFRSDGTYVLTRIDKGVYTFAAGPGNEIRLTQNLEIYNVLRDRRLEFKIEPGLRMRWPLEVGRLQRYRVDWGGPLPRPILNFNGAVDITSMVQPLADVTVPAGTFKAHRISYAFEAMTADGGRRFADVDLWYAPDARRLVKGASEHLAGLNFELTALDDRPPPVVAAPAPRTTPAQTLTPPAATGPQDAEGPKITINYPAEGARLDRSEIEILGSVTDNVAVDRVLVSVNGRMVTMSSDQAMSPRGHSIRTTVALRPGENVIEVSAVDKAGNMSQVVRSVTLTTTTAEAVAPQQPAPSAPLKRDQWAVVIGVSNYDNASIPRLKYSVSDADAFYRTLIGSMDLKKENVILLTDRADKKPTLKNIKWALGTFLSRAAQKNDTVYVFFAGHGAPEADPRGIERDGLSKYLIPQDADPDDLYSTALAMDEIQTIFSRIEADRIVVFLDACYSGAGGGRTFAAKSTRAGTVDDQFLDRLARTRGRAIVTASRTNEVSFELAELGHGIFTYYLIEGLQGKADLNRDGIVTLPELYQYLEEQVTKRSRAVGGNQHPVMKGEMEGVLPLTRVRP